MNYKHDDIKLDEKFYEKSLGFTKADLLILELKKPNRPIIPKKDSIFKKNIRKNSKKLKQNLFSSNNSDDHLYKDPKVRKNNILYIMYLLNRKFVLY